MRAVLSLLVLVSCTVPAFAADVPPVDPQGAAAPTVALPGRGNALLQLSPMYVEISDTLAAADTREKQLLVNLAVATDDETAEAIVRELEALPLGRILSILRIQARYARQENRPDLERQIKMRILELQGAGRI